jgi:hypothetical protein
LEKEQGKKNPQHQHQEQEQEHEQEEKEREVTGEEGGGRSHLRESLAKSHLGFSAMSCRRRTVEKDMNAVIGRFGRSGSLRRRPISEAPARRHEGAHA